MSAAVDPRLEVAEIHRRVIAAGGPALLFTAPRGSSMPLVTNLFGTARRAALAFGERPHRLVRRLVGAVEELLPPTPRKLWGARDLAREALRIGLRGARRGGPVTEVVERDVDLGRLPVLTTWPEDGGPFVTLPLVYTEHPDGRGHNLGMYRMQVHDRATTGMHWQIGKGGGFHYAVAEARGEALPVTVFLGGPPALILAAIAPLPENVPELMLASLIAGRRLRRSRGPGPHPLLADAEIALVGRVPPRRAPAGGAVRRPLRLLLAAPRLPGLRGRGGVPPPRRHLPGHRGRQAAPGGLLHRRPAPGAAVAALPAGHAGGRVDLWSYGETGYHSLAAAVVRERYRREAMASAFRILGEGQLSLTKFLLVTDRAVDLRDFRATLEHVLARTRPETDLYVLSNLSMDTLDYTGPAVNEGSKGVWLGLGEPVRELPREFRPATDPPPEVTAVHVFCGGCLVVGGPAVRRRRRGRGALRRPPRRPPRLRRLAAAGAHRRAGARRRQPDQLPVDHLHPLRARRRPPRRRPPHRAQPPRFRAPDPHRRPHQARLPRRAHLRPRDGGAWSSRRWKEYFPGGGVEMGDSERGHLDPA